jgi:tetratricopeptide (TPR) repeat protein
MNADKSKILIAVAVIVFGFAGVFALSAHLERQRPSLPEGYEDQDLALQGARLKGYALGFEGLIADWYWMQSLQYIGDKILNNPDANISLDDLRAVNPRLLYPYLDNATTLDPRFIAPYSYGAFVLPAIDKEQAIKICLKGIENNPDNWYLYHQLGYIYWKTKEYQKAEEVYAQGSRIEGAPPFMQLMAANMKTEGSSRETARAIYRQMYSEAANDEIKEVIRLKLLGYDSAEEREAIQVVLDDFKKQNERCPNDWREVFPLIRQVRLPNGNGLRVESQTLAPVDPLDIPYILFEKDGRCMVDLDPKKSKLPVL